MARNTTDQQSDVEGFSTWGKIDESVCASLTAEHFVVVDEVLSSSPATQLQVPTADGLLREMLWLVSVGASPSPSCINSSYKYLKQNQTSFGSALFAKPGIFEADWHDEKIRSLDELSCMHSLAASCKELVSRLKSHWKGSEEKLVPMVGEADPCSIKMQFNNGMGGCFPAHYDNPGPPNTRALTCILYLNPDWRPGHGGELTLYPFLSRTPSRSIAPLHNRLVVFRSNTMLHRVEQCHAPRFCITIWIDGVDTNSPAKTQLKLPTTIYDDDETFAATVAMLQSTPLQRSVSRAVYREIYESSLVECMHDQASAQGRGLMVAAHRQHLVGVTKNATLQRFVEALRAVLTATEEEEEEEEEEEGEGEE